MTFVGIGVKSVGIRPIQQTGISVFVETVLGGDGKELQSLASHREKQFVSQVLERSGEGKLTENLMTKYDSCPFKFQAIGTSSKGHIK